MTLWKWSRTAANNANADSTINWAEGQAPSSVNDSARALMAAAAKYRDDNSGLILTTGTSTAYIATSYQGYTTPANGDTIVVQFHTTSGAAPQLNLDSGGLKPIRIASATAVTLGRILGGSIHKLTRSVSDDCWYLNGFVLGAEAIAATTKMLFQQTSAPSGWTKDTTHNNKALRVVSGAASSGGSVDFTTAFSSSQTPAGTVGATALTEAQLASHKHFVIAQEINGSPTPSASTQVGMEGIYGNNSSYNLAGTATAAGIGLSSASGGGATHTHSFTGNAMNFAVAYVDLIIATKD